jgi:hypothetical protein
MTNVEIVHGIYAKLENRPGTLERAAKALGAKHINIDAIGLETNGNQGFVRIVTHKAKEGVDALRATGIEAFESQLAVALLSNKPNELARATSELAAAGVNVEGIVTTTDGRLAFRTNDVERTAQILRKL